MKRLFLLIACGLPYIVQAQTTSPHGVGLGSYKLKQDKSVGKKRINEAAIAKEARQQLASSFYESHPHSMRIVVPDSTTSRMPRAATPNQEAPGGIAPLPQQEQRNKRP